MSNASAVGEKFGKWFIVQTEEPFEELKGIYPDKKTAEDQLRTIMRKNEVEYNLSTRDAASAG
jgi:hypothetical protein